MKLGKFEIHPMTLIALACIVATVLLAIFGK